MNKIGYSGPAQISVTLRCSDCGEPLTMKGGKAQLGATHDPLEIGPARTFHIVPCRSCIDAITASAVSEDIRYYNSFGINALTPATIETGITRPEIISGFLEVHDLDDIERRVRRIMEQPEYHGKSFAPLFANSVLTLLKNYAGQADTSEVAA